MKKAILMLMAIMIMISCCAANKKQARSTEIARPTYRLDVPENDPRNHRDRLRIETPCAIIDTNRADLIVYSEFLEKLAENTCGDIIKKLVDLATQNSCAGFTITPQNIEYDPEACKRPRVFAGAIENFWQWPIHVEIKQVTGGEVNAFPRITACDISARGYCEVSLPSGEYVMVANFIEQPNNLVISPRWKLVDNRRKVRSRLTGKEYEWIYEYDQ